LNISNDVFAKERRQLQELVRSYRQSQILLTCVQLGIFDALSGRPASASEVAASVGADARGVELLLNAAAALGWLEKRDSHFSNSALAETHLTSAGMGRSLRLESAFYRRWGNLLEAVRTGKRPEENRRDEQPADWVRTFIHALYDASRPLAPAIAEALALPEDRPLRVLDVGGGHGGYSIALATKYPLLSATVFELPRVVPVAQEIIESAGLSSRITVQEGDFQKEELGRGYDVALVFGVLNGEPPEGRPALIRKVFAALNPGGQIVLRDMVLQPDRTGPPDAAMFALQMLLATESGGLDTSDDWETWLRSAGFAPARKVNLPPWVGSSLTVSRKPIT
jgi:2-polyprenyl-3-methyl-5-hydroxy-6-metoxy-1,4-benzoquinol methylase